jgi:hypothetical protein
MGGGRTSQQEGAVEEVRQASGAPPNVRGGDNARQMTRQHYEADGRGGKAMGCVLHNESSDEGYETGTTWQEGRRGRRRQGDVIGQRRLDEEMRGCRARWGGGAGDGCMHLGVGTIFKIIIRLFI